MTTLNDILLAVSRYCLPVHKGAATATGTTTTLIDTVRKQADDFFNNGPLFLISGTYANTFKTITDYTNSSGTFQFTTATAGNIASGTLYEAYALMSGANVYDVIGAINQALFEAGDIWQYIDYTDDNTLITATDTEEYALPSGVSNVSKMWISTDTSSPYDWRRFTHYKEKEGYLHIPYQYTGYLGDGYYLKYEYKAAHSTLSAASDTLKTQINKQWLVYAASINLIRSLCNRGDNWSTYKTQYEEAQQKIISLRPIISSINVKVHGA